MGAALVGVATLLFDLGVPPMVWMLAVGLGPLPRLRVPDGCVLFDRTIAALEIVATAMSLIYISDATRAVHVTRHCAGARRGKRSVLISSKL